MFLVPAKWIVLLRQHPVPTSPPPHVSHVLRISVCYWSVVSGTMYCLLLQTPNAAPTMPHVPGTCGTVGAAFGVWRRRQFLDVCHLTLLGQRKFGNSPRRTKTRLTLLLDCGTNTQVPTLLSSRGPPTPTQTTMKTHTIDQNLLCLRVLSWQTVRIRNPKRFLRETNSFQSS